MPLFNIKAKNRVATIHDVYHLAFGKKLGLLKRLYARLVIATAVRLSDKIITVSEFSKKELLKYTRLKKSKATVIYNGINRAVAINNFESVSGKYALPPEYILYVGNVKPHKNLRKLLEAYLLVDPALRLQYKVVIVGKKDGFITGDPALIEWINNISELHDHVVFTGFAAPEDMDTLYHYASVFVFPSIYEGFGLPPLEAMVNGCAVLVSDQSSIPEICGNGAWYFNPFDEHDIAQKISTILNNEAPRKQLIEQGSLRVLTFSWERSIALHKQLFNSLL